jgi:diguanylate cyclase (GGDEF)-like protein/PAS domain S-box-containing protein
MSSEGSKKVSVGSATGPLRRPTSAEQLAAILNSVPHVIWAADPEGRLEFVSDQWERGLGGDAAEMIGEGWIAHVHPDDVDLAVARWGEAIRNAEPFQNEFRLRMPTGDYRWVLITANPELTCDGGIERWVGTCTDVHDRVVAQIALAEKQRLYGSVLEASADCIQILSADGRLQLINAPGLALLEVPDFSELEGRFWWRLWSPEMRAQVRNSVKEARAGHRVRFSGPSTAALGTSKWWDVVVTPIRSADGTVTGLLAISRDSTAERHQAEELQWASDHDALTGLPNRRAFQNRLQAAVLRAMQTGSKVGLLLIDLDHFKHVNDMLGHAAGDALLKEFASRLVTSLRSGDFVARVGGDEFAIIAESVHSGADLLAVGDRASDGLKAPLLLQGHALSGGASLGGALFPDDAATANELFKLADTALYALKAEGRGGTKLFHAYMREEAQRTASQLSLARGAVTEATVCPYYQPKIDLRTGEVAGFEALLRWQHPTRGLQLPDTIEEAFKDYELASKIGCLMQNRVLADLQSWASREVAVGKVSINAAPAEFLRDDYAERLLEKLARAGISPACLEVEVTEHALMANASRYVCRALDALKGAGVTVALDDFGTGHSSLSHLRDFPVDVVKIDRSFVRQMAADEEIAAIVGAVIDLAASLRIQSVAEGVETRTQADMLRAAGCALAQGFLLGCPAPADEVGSGRAPRAAA